MLSIAVILLGVIALLESQGPVSQTLVLVLAVFAIVLAVLHLIGYTPFRRAAPPQP